MVRAFSGLRRLAFVALASTVPLACNGTSNDGRVGYAVDTDAGVDTIEATRPYDDMPAKSADGRTETRRAEANGLTGMTVSGAVNPKGKPTTYFFEYGTSTSYGKQTAAQAVPPRRTAHYRESWSGGLNYWQGGFTGRDLTHVASGGVDGGFVRFSEPSDTDQNHADGIGSNHLAQYMWIGTYFAGDQLPAMLGGGDPDLRDAQLSVWVRGNQWNPKGSELVFWMQADLDLETQNDDNKALRANWAYTASNLTDAAMLGTWQKVDYRLANDASGWSFAGGSVDGPKRYVYKPLDATLGHLNNDIFHMLVFVNPLDPPTGSLDFDELEITYRNHSVVLPSNGGKLVSSPVGSDDPARLVDGWRWGEGRAWRTAANPTAPQEIVYEFANPISIDTVQLHQHPDWPSKDVEVWVSVDGIDYTILSGSARLPAVMAQASPGGPNYAFYLDSPYRRYLAREEGIADVPWPSVEAKRVKVVIKSGYKPEYWGLGEIEIFGRGAKDTETDDDVYTMSADIGGLTPGTRVHYRMVSVDDRGRNEGGDKSFVVPADARPIVFTRPASRIANGSAKVEGRATALGERTICRFEYGPDTGYGKITDDLYAGAESWGRSVTTTLSGLTPGATYHYRIIGTNARGTATGEDLTFVAR